LNINYVALSEVAEFINGRAFKPEDWSTEGLPIIRIQNLTGSTKVTNYYKGKFDKKYLVKNGDILISWSASLGVYLWYGRDAILNQHIFKCNIHKGVDRNYFYYAATSILDELKKQVHGTTMQHITKDPFESTLFPLPPLPEQQRIAAILQKAERLRRLHRYAQQLRDGYLQSVFLEMFGDPTTNPKGWKIIKLSEIGNLDRGKSKNRPRNAPFLFGGKYPFIQTGDIANSENYVTSYNQTYSELGLRQSKLWPKGTLCITIAANIAKTAILTFDACFPDSIVGFTPSSEIKTEYFQYWLSFIQKELEDKAPESAQKNINLEILRNLQIPLPPFDHQEKFAVFVSRFEKLRAIQKESERQTEMLFQSLLNMAFQ